MKQVNCVSLLSPCDRMRPDFFCIGIRKNFSMVTILHSSGCKQNWKINFKLSMAVW